MLDLAFMRQLDGPVSVFKIPDDIAYLVVVVNLLRPIALSMDVCMSMQSKSAVIYSRSFIVNVIPDLHLHCHVRLNL